MYTGHDRRRSKYEHLNFELTTKKMYIRLKSPQPSQSAFELQSNLILHSVQTQTPSPKWRTKSFIQPAR
jgi:hypothetical protein